MENGPLHDDKLFRAVNDRLSNYEAPYEGADWDAMSRSLDQLPNASGFRWKISLNTILIAIGVAGISILGITLAGSNGKSTTVAPSQENAQQITTAPKQNNSPAATSASFVNNSVPTNGAQNVPLENNDALNAEANGTTSGVSTTTSASRRKKNVIDSEGLYFGDQIDRKKGFIHSTQEDPSLVNSHTDSVPGTYFDIVNGHVKKIKLNRDSSGSRTTATQTPPADNGQGIPTDGGMQGFGDPKSN